MSGESDTVLPYPGLYIGGLRNDLNPGKLAGLICNLLWKFQVQVPHQAVYIGRKPSVAFAIVDLPDESTSKHLLSKLSSLDNVRNVFNLSTITNSPNSFRVGPRLSEGPGKRQRSRSRARKNKKQKLEVEAASSVPRSSVSNHSADDAFNSMSSKPPRASRRKEKQARQENSKAGNSLPVSSSQSATSQHSGQTSESGSESEGDASSTSPPSQSSSKVISNTTVSSKESEENLPDIHAWTLERRGSWLLTDGVHRLAQVMAEDDVARSMSDRGMHSSVDRKSITTSTTGLPVPGQVSVTTSTPGIGTGTAIGFYRMGETVGRESRHSEFKQGGRAHMDRSWLQEIVGKYVCGFLNSYEGGTLYIGVSDNGMVTGFSCPQSKEDNFRLMIDEALKSIEPPIFPDAYTVRFVPVMEQNGRLSETLHVLEVEVKAVKHPKHVYDFRGNAFLRRDGSLQGPLKARQVQELTRKLLERENSGNTLKLQLHEMASQLETEREKNARMQQQLMELEDHISQLVEQLATYGHHFKSRGD